MKLTQLTPGYLTVAAIVIILCAFASESRSQSLTDSSASPPLAKPPLNQAFGNQSLDFHSDPFTGRFSYEVPIIFPPGPNGFKPSLSLGYDSSHKNGWCGVGWDVDMGYIERDIRKGVPISNGAYSDASGFIFSFAGKSGRMVGSPGLYAPEINRDGLRFVGPGGSWQVTDKSGTTYYFGLSYRISTQYGTFKWLLDGITDRNGNSIQINYNQDGGQFYLSTIVYNGNTVTFITDSSRNDKVSSVISGTKITTGMRLNTIVVNAAGSSSSRTYTLGYNNSPSTQRSLLTSISEAGGGEVLPTKRFAYQVQAMSFQSPTLWPINTSDQSGPTDWNCSIANSDTELIDINGDGLPDRVSRQFSYPYNTFKVQLNTGSGFGPVQRWNNVTDETGSADFNWSKVTGNGGTLEFVDMNGDLLPDRVSRRKNSPFTSFCVQVNNGAGFNSSTFWNNVSDYTQTSGGSYQLSTPYYEVDGINAQALLTDMNGDGLPDRVMYKASGTQFAVQLNTGAGFGNLTYWNNVALPSGVLVPVYTSPRAKDMNGQFAELIDVNGDGLPDRVYKGSGSQVQLNNGYDAFLSVEDWGLGTGYPSPLSVTDGDYSSIFADMNSDGLPDLISYVSPGSFAVHINTGSGFSPNAVNWTGVQTMGYTGAGWDHPRAWDGNGARVEIMDINGDGLPDRVMRGTGSYAGNLIVQLNSGPFPDLLTSIDNGMGATAIISYQSSRQCANSPIPFPVYVVKSITANEGWGDRTTSYTYSGGYYDVLYKEFRGFGHSIENGPVLTTEHYFYQGGNLSGDSRYKAGMAYQINETGTDGFVRHTANSINQTACSLGGTMPYINHTSSDNLPCMSKDFTYDFSYGNVTWELDTPNDSTPAVAKTFQYAGPHDKPTLVNVTGADGTQRQTLNFYDFAGNLKEKRELICDSTYATNTYTYDSYGNITIHKDPVGITTTMIYDPVMHAFPAQTTCGSFTEYATYDSRSGAVVLSTSIAGLVTLNQYDGFCRLLNTWVSAVPNGAANVMQASFSYNLGNPSVVNQFRNEPADATTGQSVTTYTLDGAGRVYVQQIQGENGQTRTINTSYDNLGQMTSQSSSGMTTTFTYDSVERPKSANVQAGDTGSPEGSTTWNYSDCPEITTVTDANGHVKNYVYDAFGRMIQITEVSAQGNFVTTLGYNGVGDLIKTIDNAGNQTLYYYNGVGEKVAMIDPDVGFWTYARDLSGRLVTQTDAKGQKVKYYYNDPLGRVSSHEGWNASNQRVSLVTYQYDSNGGDSQYTILPGQLFAIVDDEGWEKSSYDVRGRVLSNVRYLVKNGQTYATGFTYDDANRVLAISYPNASAPTVQNTYDIGAHLIGVKRIDSNGAAIAYYGAQNFDSFNRPQQMNFGNGTATTLSYYVNSKRLREFVTTIPGSITIQDSIVSYDKVGNVLSLQDNIAAHTGAASSAFSSAQYDEMNRFTGGLWSNYGQKNYTYDSIGNLKVNGEAGNGTYSYGPGHPHMVKNVNGANYTYDLNGNMTNRTGQRLYYDVYNHLTNVTSAGGAVSTFGYDADGHRLWEKSGTNALQVWIGDHYEEKGGKVLYHIAAAGRRVCTFEPAAGGTTGYNASTQEFYYYHPDYLGSSSLMTERNGTQVQHYEYSAYGRDRYTGNSSAFPASRRFTGQVLDIDTGLYYYNFRYYDPLLARFIQPDDIIPNWEDPQSYNRYSYCVNNPLRFTDPNGHGIVDNIGNYGGGIVTGFASGINPIPAQFQVYIPPSTTAEAYGRQVGESMALGVSVVELLGGGIVTGVSGTVEVGSLGTASPVAVPVGVVGVAVASHGAIGINNWVVNMQKNSQAAPKSNANNGPHGSSSISTKGTANGKVANDAKGIAGKDLPGKGEGWVKLKGKQGWKDADGNFWKKDQLHKDHWDVSNKNGDKVREVDYSGKQIWPDGPKNKNK